MPESKIETEAIILGSFNTGESNKLLFVFTRKFGLLYVHAQGVRNISSKLKNSLQDYFISDIVILLGKNNYRVVDAVFKKNVISNLSEYSLGVFSNWINLLKRLHLKDETNESLYDDFRNGIEALLLFSNDLEKIKDIEIIFVARLLNKLGYWGENKFSFVFEDDYIRNGFFEVSKERSLVINLINKALKESHL